MKSAKGLETGLKTARELAAVGSNRLVARLSDVETLTCCNPTGAADLGVNKYNLQRALS